MMYDLFSYNPRGLYVNFAQNDKKWQIYIEIVRVEQKAFCSLRRRCFPSKYEPLRVGWKKLIWLY